MQESIYSRCRRKVHRELVSLLTDRRWRCIGIDAEWVGSASGGAWVDLSSLSRNSVVYSFGLAFEISFDREIIKRTGGCSVFGYDPDPRSIQWLRREDIYLPPQMKIVQLGLAAEAGIHRFGVTDPEKMSGSMILDGYEEFIEAEFKTLEQLMEENGHSVIDYVKMDIEGAEFDLLNDWLGRKYSPPIKQLWIEFHPETKNMTIEEVECLVRSLATIGFVPVKRSYRRSPKHFLLQNIRVK